MGENMSLKNVCSLKCFKHWIEYQSPGRQDPPDFQPESIPFESKERALIELTPAATCRAQSWGSRDPTAAQVLGAGQCGRQAGGQINRHLPSLLSHR